MPGPCSLPRRQRLSVAPSPGMRRTPRIGSGEASSKHPDGGTHPSISMRAPCAACRPKLCAHVPPAPTPAPPTLDSAQAPPLAATTTITCCLGWALMQRTSACQMARRLRREGRAADWLEQQPSGLGGRVVLCVCAGMASKLRDAWQPVGRRVWTGDRVPAQRGLRVGHRQ